MDLALELTARSKDLVVCTNAPAELFEHDREKLTPNRTVICEDATAELRGPEGILENIVFHNGRS